MDQDLFARYSEIIRAGVSSPEDSRLLIDSTGPLGVYYAPFDHVNLQARVVIVGITPGATQAINAIREAQRQLIAGADYATVLKAAKRSGAFSGAMRPNLVALLDSIGLDRWLGIRSCDDLFGTASHLVQTTSVLRYPVFVNGANYSGTPDMVRHTLLRQQMIDYFGQEASRLRRAVFVPLGDKVACALHFLATQGVLDRARILDGLPHPSGANAERIAYFLGRKSRDTLSSKTDPGKLDQARIALRSAVIALN